MANDYLAVYRKLIEAAVPRPMLRIAGAAS
jgi:hypothetical protein